MVEYPQRFLMSLPMEARAQGPLVASGLTLSPCLLSGGAIGIWREYPLDEDASIWRISPIFPSVRAAVRWLIKASPRWIAPQAESSYERWPEFDRPLDPRRAAVSFQLANQYGMWAYDLLTPNAAPRLTVIFRGQRDAHWPLLPRMFQILTEHGLDKKAQLQRIVEECNKTSRFVGEFFNEPTVRSQYPGFYLYGTLVRALIARHYGYYSQFIDFSTDPGVAAFFATYGQMSSANRPRFGAIWYLVEPELKRHFEPKIERSAHFEHRFFSHSSIDALRCSLSDDRLKSRLSWSGVLSEWERVAWRAALHKVSTSQVAFPVAVDDVEFSISTYYAPGSGIPRMYAQSYCAIEVNTHLGPAKALAMEEALDWHRLLEVLTGRVVFIQKGGPYCRPPGGYWRRRAVSEESILPLDDSLMELINRYQERINERPL